MPTRKVKKMKGTPHLPPPPPPPPPPPEVTVEDLPVELHGPWVEFQSDDVKTMLALAPLSPSVMHGLASHDALWRDGAPLRLVTLSGATGYMSRKYGKASETCEREGSDDSSDDGDVSDDSSDDSSDDKNAQNSGRNNAVELLKLRMKMDPGMTLLMTRPHREDVRSAIEHLPRLQALRFAKRTSPSRGDHVDEDALCLVTRLRELRSLDLSHVHIEESAMFLGSLVRLKHLEALQIRISEAGNLWLALAPSVTLREFGLWGTALTAVDLSVITSRFGATLTKLTLSQCRVIGTAPRETLAFGMEFWRGFPAMSELRLCDLGLHLADLDAIATVRSLRVLHIRHEKNVGAATLQALATLPALAELNVSGCCNVGDGGLLHLAQSESLQRIDVSGTGATRLAVQRLIHLPAIEFIAAKHVLEPKHMRLRLLEDLAIEVAARRRRRWGGDGDAEKIACKRSRK